jgi:Flp pilus assembly pilin Flp
MAAAAIAAGAVLLADAVSQKFTSRGMAMTGLTG